MKRPTYRCVFCGKYDSFTVCALSLAIDGDGAITQQHLTIDYIEDMECNACGHTDIPDEFLYNRHEWKDGD